jgi:acyl CoA:acetate/3-ketoacid CoA transferase alpha subunit
MSEQEAIAKFVSDGDYICYDCNMVNRGPSSLLREVIRQRKKNLWVGGKFTYFVVNLLVGAGCVRAIDIGFIGIGQALTRALDSGEIKITEWSNSALTMRLLAGAMGLPFLPIRFLGGSDSFYYSGAKIVEDPFTGKEITVVPALNPDVSLVHVNQCDIYGNARIFGTTVSPVETVAAAKKAILSTEEIIDNEEIRREPQRTTIPYYLVDGVVEAPFGAHPGSVPGLYSADREAIYELAASGRDTEARQGYLEKYIYIVASHQEYLEKIGLSRLLELKRLETIKEGYYR